MKKVTKAGVKRAMKEMSRARRRKGGDRRIFLEMVFSWAWKAAWEDDFRQTPVMYVGETEAWFQQMGIHVDQFEEPKKKPHLRLVKPMAKPGQ